MSLPWKILFAVLVLATAMSAGFFVYGRLGPGPDHPSVGRTLPDVTLLDLDGKPHSLAEWQGRPLIVNFWATWCEPCRREIPLLEKLRGEYAPQGVEVIGIAIDFKENVAAYARKQDIPYPLFVAERNAIVFQSFGGGMALPTTFFADRKGRIVAGRVGELQERQARKLVNSILKPR